MNNSIQSLYALFNSFDRSQLVHIRQCVERESRRIVELCNHAYNDSLLNPEGDYQYQIWNEAANQVIVLHDKIQELLDCRDNTNEDDRNGAVKLLSENSIQNKVYLYTVFATKSPSTQEIRYPFYSSDSKEMVEKAFQANGFTVNKIWQEGVIPVTMNEYFEQFPEDEGENEMELRRQEMDDWMLPNELDN